MAPCETSAHSLQSHFNSRELSVFIEELGVTQLLLQFHRDEEGATATEYIILLVCIACFVIMVVKTFGQTLEEKYRWADQRVAKFVTF